MLAIETILGALTGYFTNDIAIRQLFAKNGVVVRERAQFTEMIVQVLQDQIIDEETVRALAENPEMAMMFERFLRTLLTEELPYALSDCALADIDSDGALRQLAVAHIQSLDLTDARFDSAALAKRLDAVFTDDVFVQSAALALANLAKCSLSELGAGALVKCWLRALEAMDAEDFSRWLSGWGERLQAALESQWQEGGAESLRLQDLLTVDAAALEQMLEQFILAGQRSQHARWLDVLKNPALQEQLYVLAERLLQSLLAAHLPTLVEAFAPILQEDRAEIEGMLLESVAESGENPMFCDVVAGLLEQRFAETTDDGRDWLSAFLARFADAEEAESLCQELAAFLLSWVVHAIDRWRRVTIEAEDEVAAIHDSLMKWRPLAVTLLEALLALPLRRLLSQQMLATLIDAGVEALAKNLSPEALAQMLRKISVQILEKPLSAHLLTAARQEMLLAKVQDLWQQHGATLLARLDLQEATLKEALLALFDQLYQQPLARLVCRSREAVPYKTMADGLRGEVFTEMRPFLGRMTKEQLDALSHEEIRSLVLDMLGHEMRPLAYLGGGIGAIAGAATGVAMEMSGVTPDPDALAALMTVRTGMYGVVGYGTNVAAVAGLFRPYKKKLGFQGLISKNQTRFAEKMKEMAASYIINDDIWRTQVQAFSQRLDADFDELLHQGLQKLADAHDTHWQQTLKEMAKNHAGHLLYASLQKDRLVAALAARLSDPEPLAGFCAEAHLLQRGIDQLAMREAASGALSQPLLKWLQGRDAESWTQLGNRILGAMTLPKEQEFYARLWQHLLPFYKGLPEMLLDNLDSCSGLVDDMLRKQFSFTMLLGYQMAGGRQFVSAILQAFFAKKLPGYLFRREADVAEAAVGWMQRALAGKSATDLGVSVSESDGDWLVEMSAALSAPQLQQFLLALAAHMRELPEQAEARLMTRALRLAGALTTDSGEYVWQNIWAALAWDEVIGRFEPAVVMLGDELVREGSLNALFSLPSGTLQQRLRAALVLTPEEERRCIAFAAKLWQLVEPVCIATVIREGRALVLLVDVPGLVEERINALSPELLEQMVRGIAQPYFTRVERMGWLGAVVAIPATLASRALGGF